MERPAEKGRFEYGESTDEENGEEDHDEPEGHYRNGLWTHELVLPLRGVLLGRHSEDSPHAQVVFVLSARRMDVLPAHTVGLIGQ